MVIVVGVVIDFEGVVKVGEDVGGGVGGMDDVFGGIDDGVG